MGYAPPAPFKPGRFSFVCKEEDLDKMVEVDGTQVTLENLATMMAIEAEIDRVRETYFSGETPDLTEEQQAALESLANRLGTQGITLYNPDALTFPSGVDHGARVSVQVSGTGVTANTDGSVTVPNSAATLTATFSLAGRGKDRRHLPGAHAGRQRCKGNKLYSGGEDRHYSHRGDKRHGGDSPFKGR